MFKKYYAWYIEDGLSHILIREQELFSKYDYFKTEKEAIKKLDEYTELFSVDIQKKFILLPVFIKTYG